MRRIHLRATALMLAMGSRLFVPGLGCSSGIEGSVTAADAGDFIAKYCAEYTPCCAALGRPSDGAQCRAVLTVFGSGPYDSSAANACLAEWRAAARAPSFCATTTKAAAPSCEKVFGKGVGTRTPGETCTKDDECAPSAEGRAQCAILFKGGGELRKCQVQVDGKAGDAPCVGTVDGEVTSYSGSASATDVAPKAYLCNLSKSLYCDSTSQKCTAAAKVGEPCSDGGSGYGCGKEAYCDFAGRKCVGRKSVGETCTTSSDQCAQGNYCDDKSNKCAAALAEGAPCASSWSCASRNCVNKRCSRKGAIDLTAAFLCGGG